MRQGRAQRPLSQGHFRQTPRLKLATLVDVVVVACSEACLRALAWMSSLLLNEKRAYAQWQNRVGVEACLCGVTKPCWSVRSTTWPRNNTRNTEGSTMFT